MKIKIKEQRKVFIFILCLAAGMVSSIFMADTQYKVFIEGIVWLAVGFFAGNAFEHISRRFGRNDPPPPPDPGCMP